MIVSGCMLVVIELKIITSGCFLPLKYAAGNINITHPEARS